MIHPLAASADHVHEPGVVRCDDCGLVFCAAGVGHRQSLVFAAGCPRCESRLRLTSRAEVAGDASVSTGR